MQITETDVMKSWNRSDRESVVTILCITFNHVDYIKETLDSLLYQKTNFAFEILIHDDASTDGTSDVIREYEKKFPSMVKAVIQQENQYSKRPVAGLRFLFPLVKTKYVAICDGDDFWSSEYKLQKQIAIMEKNKRISLVHSDINHLVKKSSGEYLKCNNVNNKLQYTPAHGNFKEEHWFDLGIYTCTMLFRLEVVNYILESAVFAEDIQSGDNLIVSVASQLGDIFYIDEALATYRIHKTSITRRVRNTKVRLAFGLHVTRKFLCKYLRKDENYIESVLSSSFEKVYRSVLRYGKFSDVQEYLVPLKPSKTQLMYAYFLLCIGFPHLYSIYLNLRKNIKYHYYYHLAGDYHTRKENK